MAVCKSSSGLCTVHFFPVSLLLQFPICRCGLKRYKMKGEEVRHHLGQYNYFPFLLVVIRARPVFEYIKTGLENASSSSYAK